MNLKPNVKQGLTTFAGSTLGKLIGGRKTTDDGVGNALSTIGNTAGFILPGWLGAGVSAGFNILGGGYNAMFGYEKNNEAIAKVNSELSALNGLKFNASSTNDLISQSDFSLIDSVNNKLGEDGLFSSKIKNLENEYNRKIALANEQALSNFSLSARNLDNMNDKKLLANYSAYGGPITMEYTGIMSPFGNRFNFGGELNTQGADFTNGLLHINNGGSHESNPYEGVPMGADAKGVPNLVEEGETVFNDYVFSNRIAVPKAIRDKYKLRGNKELTFAEASKKIAKESEERPNDPISKRGLEASMNDLMIAQEMIKEKENKKKKVNKFEDGGPKKRDTRLRYAPAVGLGLMTLTDALGITNKPKYNNADAIINLGVNASSAPPKVGWSPINNYLRYNPFDTMFYANQLAAQANAARRAIINNSNGNRMTAIAGLLGSDYNYQKNLSNLYREAEEYNLEQRQKVENFNRATNIANAEGFMKAALANQDAEMKARSLGLEAQMAGYKMREATRLAAEEDRAANLSGFINALGNIGKDNATSNQIKFAIATGNPIGKDLLKLLGYKKGGYLKKKKRGLTY